MAKVFQEAQGPSSEYRPDGGKKAVGPPEFRTMLSALGLQAERIRTRTHVDVHVHVHVHVCICICVYVCCAHTRSACHSSFFMPPRTHTHTHGAHARTRDVLAHMHMHMSLYMRVQAKPHESKP